MKKITWKEISGVVKNINRSIFELMEPFSDLDFPLYIAEYRYGDYFGVKSSVFLPDKNNNLYLLGSNKTPNDIMRDLGYGEKSLPLAMIIDKYCEWNNTDPYNSLVYPRYFQGPGSICNQEILFEEEITMENSSTSAAAGAQSTFIVPHIGSKKNHQRIQADFNLQIDAPKSYNEHSSLFKILSNHSDSEHQWRAKILFFSESWINAIRKEDKFSKLREFFLRNLLKKQTMSCNISRNNDPFIPNKEVNKLKPSPYQIDSVKYIFNLILGSGNGYTPATSNDYLPLETIHNIYTECYKIAYTPITMVPCSALHKKPTYYSLQYPSAPIHSFKGSKSDSKFQELASIGAIINEYKDIFISIKESSPLKRECLHYNFSYFHHKAKELDVKDKAVIIEPSTNMEKEDDGFKFSFNRLLRFPVEAKFFRGCIKLTSNQQ